MLYLIGLYGVGLYYVAQPPIDTVFSDVVSDAIEAEIRGDPLTEAGIRASLEKAIDWYGYGVRVVFIIMTPLVVIGAVYLSGVWRLWAFWKVYNWSTTEAVVPAALGLLFLTEVFAFYTAVDTGDPARSIEWYGWHIVNQLPLLDAANTLNWRPQLEYESIPAGAGLLIFKILILMPLIALGHTWWERHFGAKSEDALEAEPEDAQMPRNGLASHASRPDASGNSVEGASRSRIRRFLFMVRRK